MEQWDDIWFNFDEPLTLNPHLGQEIPGTPVRVLRLTTDPVLAVFYHVDDDAAIITLEDILEGW